MPAKRAKRKAFGVLSVAGKRKALRDVRSLFKTKEEEYETPTSAMAGFVIQQVTSLTFAYIYIHFGPALEETSDKNLQII